MPADLAAAAVFVHGPTNPPGETINRINQKARLRTTTPASRLKSGPARERKPTGSLATALETNQAISGTVSRAKRNPAGFARHERSTLPRMNHANEVVMPQVGHSRPVTSSERTRPESKLSMRAETTRVRLQPLCHAQEPPQSGRRDQEQTTGWHTQSLSHGGASEQGRPSASMDDHERITPNCKGFRKEIETYSKIAIATRPKN